MICILQSEYKLVVTSVVTCAILQLSHQLKLQNIQFVVNSIPCSFNSLTAPRKKIVYSLRGFRIKRNHYLDNVKAEDKEDVILL